MQRGYWTLDENHQPVKTDDVLVWGRYFKTADRVVGNAIIDGVHISTVFLGIDHNYLNDRPPILFKTMIFGGEHDGYQDRCSTWVQAEQMHDKACALVRGEPQ